MIVIIVINDDDGSVMIVTVTVIVSDDDASIDHSSTYLGTYRTQQRLFLSLHWRQTKTEPSQ